MTWAFRRRCPHCKNRRFGRGHRHNLIERAISILFLPYRCDECDLRFFGYRGWTQTDGPGLHRFGFAVSVAVIAVSVWSLTHSLQEAPRTKGRDPGSERAVAAAEQTAPPPAALPPVATAKPAPAIQEATKAPVVKPSPPRRDARPHASMAGSGVRLRSNSSVVIVASDQLSAQAIRLRSRGLGELIHNGALFSISNGTAAAVEEQKDGVVRVKILQGAMAGKQGWVPDGAISAK